MAELRVPHVSWLDHIKAGKKIRPRNLARVVIDYKLSSALTNIALDIFADASNANCSFQESVLAVYLSGLENGIMADRDAD